VAAAIIGRMTYPAGPAQRVGAAAERFIASRLIGEGWEILARNARIGRDELDLVGIDPGPPRTLVVVEVRWRGRRDFGLAEESLDHRKRAALRRAIGAMIGAGGLPDGKALPRLPLRVDLVAVDPGPDGAPSVRHHRGIRP
jgi:putative endonuclease